MLAIRMQRTGRRGHAMFRVVVQDARLTPTSGKVVAAIGSYDPHAKTVILDKEKASFYLEHGAQPSDSTARLLKREGVKLPEWVTISDTKARTVRNPDKRRSTRPEEPKADVSEAPAEVVADTPTEKPAAEAPAEVATEAAETPAETAEAEVSEAAPEVVAAETPEEVIAEEAAEVVTEEAEAVEAEAPAADDKAKA